MRWIDYGERGAVERCIIDAVYARRGGTGHRSWNGSLLFVLNHLPEKQHELCQTYTFLTKLGTGEVEELMDGECLLHPDSAFARK
ncbi:MAG: hypothetical protein HFH91_14085 [Lachnospiraceae bacterium]|nr:hypothetical protein [Lachnospiraceae bacterium]